MVANPQSQLSKTFLQIENQLNIKKVMGRICGCILTVVLTVSTNKIPYTIYNSIALILCIDRLDMPFNVNKVTMITVSGFITI